MDSQTMHSSGLDNVLASYNTHYYVTDQENNWNSYPQIVTLALRSVGFMKLMTYGFWTSLVWV